LLHSIWVFMDAPLYDSVRDCRRFFVRHFTNNLCCLHLAQAGWAFDMWWE